MSTQNVRVTNLPPQDSKYRVAWDMAKAIASEESGVNKDRDYILRLARQCVMAIDPYYPIEEVVGQSKTSPRS